MSTVYPALAGLLFLTSMAQLALCLYEAVCPVRTGRRIADAAIFLALLLLTALVSAASIRQQASAAFPPLPLLLASVFALVRAAVMMRRTYRASKETLSPTSIRQALDNLNSGVLFADETGRVILANHTIARLALPLSGSYPQTRGDLESALSALPAGSGVERLGDTGALYRFPDGRVWRFQTVPLTDGALTGYTQTTAQDVTALYETNAGLERENAALQEANRSMRRMMDRIADRIREQETLNLKMRIHNDIGTSLIALTEMARGGAREDLDKQLETLRFAVSCFTQNRAGVPGAFEDVYRQAAEMGVELKLEGYIPQNATVEQLIAAAAGECVTNCVRHARGRTVTVGITERRGVCTAKITNDGQPPAGPIVEGDGLSALRKRVEKAGGEMHISHSPRFLLILNIQETEPKP